jgi:hypothetical protein
MKKLIILSFVISAACALITLPVSASPFPENVANDVYGVIQGGVINGTPTANDNNDSEPDISDAVTRLEGTAYSRNTDVDPLFVEPDYVWETTDDIVSVVLIGSSAIFDNTVGAYTGLGTGGGQTDILGPLTGFDFAGDGTMADPYPAAQANLGAGVQFGWFLNVSGWRDWDYFSEPGLNLEDDGLDHMMTFRLPEAAGTTIYIETGAGVSELTLNDPYLIAWEDLPLFRDETPPTLGDDDYDDMMFLVDNVVPIPIPPTMLLLASGLIGLVGLRRKLKK